MQKDGLITRKCLINSATSLTADNVFALTFPIESVDGYEPLGVIQWNLYDRRIGEINITGIGIDTGSNSIKACIYGTALQSTTVNDKAYVIVLYIRT